MLDTHKPTVDVTEVNNMGKVIDFDPRDFKADKSCENNVIKVLSPITGAAPGSARQPVPIIPISSAT